ncbi:class II aldolase/adducin family protein [Bradyrhizobium sp. HKCCYLS3077]|uniref:class II aldolase/adducin family protein n=1 Tax=Bradyrhizobium sp. HKCCYLS3077 TaxID=3420761 RepID=UPI003EBF553F
MSSFSRFAAIAVATLLSIATSHAQDAISGVPRELLEDIATGSRVLADLGVVDAFGHVSARHPTNPKHFLMARSIAPAQVTANDIMEFDENGEPVDARNRAVFLERFIHAEVYKARPDVNAVVHTHSPGVVPFSVSRTPLRPLYHNAAFLGEGAPVWEIGKEFGVTDMLVRNNAIGKSLAAALGDKSVVLMRGHGDVTVGPVVQAAVFRAYYTDVNARLQAQAIGLGSDVTYLSAEEAAKADGVNMVIMDRAWALWKQKVTPAAK